jgi:hypothetical protein
VLTLSRTLRPTLDPRAADGAQLPLQLRAAAGAGTGGPARGARAPLPLRSRPGKLPQGSGTTRRAPAAAISAGAHISSLLPRPLRGICCGGSGGY